MLTYKLECYKRVTSLIYLLLGISEILCVLMILQYSRVHNSSLIRSSIYIVVILNIHVQLHLLSDLYHNLLVFTLVIYVFLFSNYYFMLYNPGRNEFMTINNTILLSFPIYLFMEENKKWWPIKVSGTKDKNLYFHSW